MSFFVLVNLVNCLSWNCQYDIFGNISQSHFLYKEDNVNEVKWLEKYEYCRAKGDQSVYNDSGQGKCEFSRGLCYWNNGTCENTNKGLDLLSECQELLNNNILVGGKINDTPSVITPIVIKNPKVSFCRRR